ncbi:hypothetical protein [Amycolatopsis sp. FDAARGOS 1241]|uniref:hypothetical protein n=1 Tax=Amycolatopsis sp. FDAARGOS 1241 TaxID=2778070 RepID=UPI00194E650E|nr:hypothetical protein [Amycolatopsis sp. FDAARGOS 1241]QRP45915.1 hypothetical protein I6J71_43790 [Amycolatopsis sp. FDAARGOS 1241]
MRRPTTSSCHCCGKPVSADNLAWDYEWPAPFAELPAAQLLLRSESFIRTRDFGSAIRVILAVKLDSGHTSTLGVWLSSGRRTRNGCTKPRAPAATRGTAAAC